MSPGGLRPATPAKGDGTCGPESLLLTVLLLPGLVTAERPTQDHAGMWEGSAGDPGWEGLGQGSSEGRGNTHGGCSLRIPPQPVLKDFLPRLLPGVKTPARRQPHTSPPLAGPL